MSLVPVPSRSASVLSHWGIERDLEFMEKLCAEYRCSGVPEKEAQAFLSSGGKTAKPVTADYIKLVKAKADVIRQLVGALRDSIDTLDRVEVEEYLKGLLKELGRTFDGDPVAQRQVAEAIYDYNTYYSKENGHVTVTTEIS